VVRHSHDRSPSAEFDRTRLLHRRLRELFGLRTIPTIASLSAAIGHCVLLHLRCERTTPNAWPRAVALAVAWPLGQYLGAKEGKVGSEK
jgi:hypothetical protein